MTDREAPLLLVDTKDRVATLTLNRPDQRNSLSVALMTEMQAALEKIADNPDIGAVIIAASGPGFCAGHDLKELQANNSPAFTRALFNQCSRLMQQIVHLPKPVIARVHGIATAAGCQLVASADLAIAAEGARFATPGVNLGLFCSTPMVALSRNVGRKQAMQMLLTGEMIEAETALSFGLINRVVPLADLDAEVAALAAKITSKSPLTLKIGKTAFYRQLEMPLDEAYDYASEVMALNMEALDAGEGISAFLEKRPPCWCGK
jgi:enoyl-CoA hydratase/carnithine racemase